MKVKHFGSCSGYGGDEFGMNKAKVDYVSVGFSEIDKTATSCYLKNHGGINFGDICKIDPGTLSYFDIFTAGFPCQPFSTEGLGLGELDNRGIISNHIIRIAEVKKPKVIFLENVRGLITKKHYETFKNIISELERIGYIVKWKLLNSKNYGVPQNRERVYIVCFRKDLEENFNKFSLPEYEELKIKPMDLLENEVDKKYFIDLDNGIYSNFIEREDENNFVRVRQATKKGFIEAYAGDIIDFSHPKSETRRGRVQSGVCGALTTSCNKAIVLNDLSIRRLTPREYFRLMGFFNDEINLDGLTDGQAYKLAGNGWDINLVSKIFKKIQETGVFEE